MSERMNTLVRILRTPEEIEAYARNPREAKGISRIERGGSRVAEIAILLPNNKDLADVENTFLHEGMGHDGLRLLFPTKALLDNALDELYNASNDTIKADIDARAKRMYDAEVDRIFREKQAARESVADANSNYYTDMAEAHAEANTKREQMKRDATEEYGANVAGKVGEKGFEKMTAEEQTFWGKMKALLQQAFENLLRALKIPKMRKWTDKQWAYIYHKAYKIKKARGASLRSDHNGSGWGPIEEAEDLTMRRKTGWDLEISWRDQMRELTESKKASMDQTDYAREDSRKPVVSDTALTSETLKADAKVSKISENLKQLSDSSEAYTITPAVYAGKSRGGKPGKETPMYRVTFNRPLTEEQERAVKAFANEAIGEKKGRFATKRGWPDREAADGSWLFRSEEDARKAGEMIGNEEAVADAQPLSREDIEHAAMSAEKPARKKPAPKPANTATIEDIVEKPSAPAPAQEGTMPKGRFKVTDEMKAQEDELRRLLGIDDDEGSTDSYFRDPD